MRSWLIIVCIVAQLSVLGYMVLGRESIINSGDRIFIATAPLDPRDPFRGDFVRLRYSINQLNDIPKRWEPTDYKPSKGDVIYAVLKEQGRDVHSGSYITNIKPEQSPFLRGRIVNAYSFRGSAKFGIEQLFIEQGSGRQIEDRRGIRGGMQNAMEAEVAINDAGKAVLVGYRWSPLGIKIELTSDFTNEIRALQNTEGTQSDLTSDLPSTPSIQVTVQNLSDSPVTLDNPGDNCGFNIELVREQPAFSVPRTSCAASTTTQYKTLAPQQSFRFDVHLADPRWHVILQTDKGKLTGDLRDVFDNSTANVQDRRFRIVYRYNTDSNQNSTTTELWQGVLQSQAFSWRGALD